MKKSTILAIFALVAIIGIGVIVGMSRTEEKTAVNNSETKKVGYCEVVNQKGLDLEKDNTASEIGENEVKVTCENFKTEVEDFKGVVMVDMYSPTCPHCQKVGPVISAVAKEVGDKYKIAKVNVMAYTSLATEFDIQSVPALIFFKEGKEVKRLVGAQEKETILKTLEEVSK